MPNDLPLDTLFSQILIHTPLWVWLILALITAIGLRQAVAHTLPGKRLVALPIVLAGLSLYGAAGAFGVHAGVLTAWLLGAALAALASHALVRPGQAQHLGAGRLAMPGSLGPLLAMWSVFAVRYVSSVTLALHPGWNHGTWFSLVVPMVYGALSGLFMGRALRILRSAQPAPVPGLA
ncbi:MAG TPA: DUF6622 family protein [Rhizobacter sp.]|nr:DUF6622 family protein [Rhizobacter sp.]